MDNRKALLLTLLVITSITFVGAGYASDHSGSSENSDNDLTTVYMITELNDMAVSAECTFDFDDITYYRDRPVTGGAAATAYKSATGESGMVKLFVRSSGVSHVDASMTVRLNEQYTDATFTMYFYDSNQTRIGSPIVLTDTDQSVIIEGGMTTDTTYYCKAAVAIADATLNSNPFGTLSFGVTFTATASDGT